MEDAHMPPHETHVHNSPHVNEVLELVFRV
jgi:hypothetical protein